MTSGPAAGALLLQWPYAVHGAAWPPRRIRGTAATFFFPPRGPGAPSNQRTFFRHGHLDGGPPTPSGGSFWLLRSRGRVGAPVVFQDRVQQGGAARPQRRGGRARFVLRVRTPMRATARVNDPAPCPCAPDAWRCGRTWSMALPLRQWQTKLQQRRKVLVLLPA
jgi:hypothetical protein